VAVGRDSEVGRDDFSIRVAVSKSGCGRGRVGYQAESCPIRKKGEKGGYLFAGCTGYDQEVVGGGCWHS
jgi:hypothetical protein